MQKSEEMHKVDLLDTLQRNRLAERSQWMQSIIHDELHKPLHVDKGEKFPLASLVEPGLRRDMDRIRAHEQSILKMERALAAKERLRTEKKAKMGLNDPRKKKADKKLNKKRAKHFKKLGKLRSKLREHRLEKEREVRALVQLQKDAPLQTATLHSVDHRVATHQQRQFSKSR